MRMDEALEWAADYTTRNKLFEPVLNNRGYPDGWKPPTPADKAGIIVGLANEIVKVEDEKFLQGILQELHNAAMQTNEDDMVRYINSIHNSLFKHMHEKGN